MAVGTSKFDRTNPLTADDSTTIPTAVNDCVTLLDGALSADNFGTGGVGSSINVADSSRLASSGWISVGAEIISYTGKSGNSLTGIVRGAQSTQIQAHATRSSVLYNFTASHLNVIVNALIALQQLFVNYQVEQGTTGGGATITLLHTPITGKKVILFINGAFYTDGTDFNLSGTVLTFTGGGPYPPAGLAYTAVYFSQ